MREVPREWKGCGLGFCGSGRCCGGSLVSWMLFRELFSLVVAKYTEMEPSGRWMQVNWIEVWSRYEQTGGGCSYVNYCLRTMADSEEKLCMWVSHGAVRKVNAFELGRGEECSERTGGVSTWVNFCFRTMAESEVKFCTWVSEFGRVCERIKLPVCLDRIKGQRCSRIGDPSGIIDYWCTLQNRGNNLSCNCTFLYAIISLRMAYFVTTGFN